MTKSRLSEEQINGVLKEADAGMKVADSSRAQNGCDQCTAGQTTDDS